MCMEKHIIVKAIAKLLRDEGLIADFHIYLSGKAVQIRTASRNRYNIMIVSIKETSANA